MSGVHDDLATLRALMENAIGGRRTLNDHKTWLRRDQERINGYWDALERLEAEIATMSEALEKIGESGPRPRQFRSDLEYVIHLQNIARRALAAGDKP